MTLNAADLLANAPNLTNGVGRPVKGTADWDTTTATAQPGEERDRTVWHKVYVAAPGICSFDHSGSAPADTYMYVYRAVNGNAQAIGDLVMVTYDDDAAGNAQAKCVVTANAGGDWFYIASSLYGGGAYSGGKLNWNVPQLYAWGTLDFARSLADSGVGISQPAKTAQVRAMTIRTPAYIAAHAGTSGASRPTSGVLLPRPGVNR